MAVLISNLSQPQYAAIGRIACEWSHLEQTLQEFVWTIAGIPIEMGLKITTELGAVTLLNMILTLARDGHFEEARQPAIYHAIFNLQDQINTLRGKRNFYVHRDWARVSPRKPEIESLHFTAKGKLVGRRAVTTVAEMDGVVQEIATLHAKLFEIKTDYQAGRLVALPRKSKSQPQQGRHKSQPSSGKTPPSPP